MEAVSAIGKPPDLISSEMIVSHLRHCVLVHSLAILGLTEAHIIDEVGHELFLVNFLLLKVVRLFVFDTMDHHLCVRLGILHAILVGMVSRGILLVLLHPLTI